MKRVVADTGPLLHLHEAAALHLFPLVGEIFISSAVLAELRSHVPGLWPEKLPDWLRVASLSRTANERALAWQEAGLLHRGEAESLALACELQPDWFVTDDAAARVIAESLQLEAHGSLGIVLWCAATRQLPSSESKLLLDGLENSSLWMSPIVRARARSALAEIYGPGKEDE